MGGVKEYIFFDCHNKSVVPGHGSNEVKKKHTQTSIYVNYFIVGFSAEKSCIVSARVMSRSWLFER